MIPLERRNKWVLAGSFGPQDAHLPLPPAWRLGRVGVSAEAERGTARGDVRGTNKTKRVWGSLGFLLGACFSLL